jgi:hypothetical protein
MQGTAVPFRIAMSGKNFRVAQTGQRTNGEGKQVSNKVLLATPDNEYELMRADLTYVDLPHHLSLHEPTQNIEFVYFPNRGMVSQVVVTKDGRTVEVGVVGNEGYVGAGLAVGLSRSSVREIIQVAGDGFRMMGNALERILRTAAVADDLEQAQRAARDASGTDRGVQPAARYTAAPVAVAADDAGSREFGSASNHPRFHCHHDGYGPSHGERGSSRTAKKRNHRIRARRGEGCEPQETPELRL